MVELGPTKIGAVIESDYGDDNDNTRLRRSNLYVHMHYATLAVVGGIGKCKFYNVGKQDPCLYSTIQFHA